MATYVLPGDRVTTWKPGVTYNGGISSRTTVYATITSTGTSADRRAAIQAALDACPAGQVVLLGPGDFYLSGALVISRDGVTLRGDGVTTVLRKIGSTSASGGGGGSASAAVTMSKAAGLNLDGVTTAFAASTAFTANGAKGSFTVSVASTAGFSVGDLVRVDELSGAAWRTDPCNGSRQVWASADYRVTYAKHNPTVQWIDDFATGEFPADLTHWYRAYTVPDRPTCEMKEIASIGSGTLTFSTPLHIDYRTANTAKVSKYNGAVLDGASVENLRCYGFDLGTIEFKLAKNCWASRVEADYWFDKPFNFMAAFRCEARRCYQHGTPWPSNSAENYAFIFNWASADCLIENCTSIECDKVIAARAAGAGCVVGYNYLDRGYMGKAFGNQDSWVEVGANASHLVGPHHVLFEGNWGFNADSDFTHGNSTNIAHYRNNYPGFRTPFVDITDGVTLDDYAGNGPGATEPTNGPRRCVGVTPFGYWHTFVGNVLGVPGRMSTWATQGTDIFGDKSLWLMGWDPTQNLGADPNVINPAFPGAILRDGNFDHKSGTQRWHGYGGNGTGSTTPPTDHDLPNSLYLSGKPAFFGSYSWPYADPTTGALSTLPAKAAFDAGTPTDPELTGTITSSVTDSLTITDSAGYGVIESYPTADTYQADIYGAVPGITVTVDVSSSTGETLTLTASLPVDVSDALTITDSGVARFKGAATDTLTVTDSAAASIASPSAVAVLDALSFADSCSVVLSQSIAVSTPFLLAASFAWAVLYTTANADTLSVSDSCAIVQTAANADALSLSDTVAVSLTVAASDSIAITDSAQAIAGTLTSCADTLTIEDSSDETVSLQSSAADALSFADSASVSIELGTVPSDNTDELTFSDFNATAYAIGTADGLAFSDAAYAYLGSLASASDSVSFLDATTASVKVGTVRPLSLDPGLPLVAPGADHSTGGSVSVSYDVPNGGRLLVALGLFVSQDEITFDLGTGPLSDSSGLVWRFLGSSYGQPVLAWMVDAPAGPITVTLDSGGQPVTGDLVLYAYDGALASAQQAGAYASVAAAISTNLSIKWGSAAIFGWAGKAGRGGHTVAADITTDDDHMVTLGPSILEMMAGHRDPLSIIGGSSVTMGRTGFPPETQQFLVAFEILTSAHPPSPAPAIVAHPIRVGLVAELEEVGAEAAPILSGFVVSSRRFTMSFRKAYVGCWFPVFFTSFKDARGQVIDAAGGTLLCDVKLEDGTKVAASATSIDSVEGTGEAWFSGSQTATWIPGDWITFDGLLRTADGKVFAVGSGKFQVAETVTPPS
jgi:hypothetical protein